MIWKNSAKSLKRTLEKRHKLHFCFIPCELHRILPLAIWGTAVLGLRRPYIFPYLWGAQNSPHFWGETKDKQKQPSRGVLRKRCYGNMQQIYRQTPMPKWGFNKDALQLYLNLTSVWLLPCKLAAYFQNTFSKEHLWRAASGQNLLTL